VPNKTIYVSDGDLVLFQRAQELAGGNLSAAIAGALRRFVDVEEGRREGFDEVILRVGTGSGRKVRFMGILLGEWADSSWTSGGESWRVYRTRGGKYALYHEHGPEYKSVDAAGKPAGWRGHLGLGNISYGSAPRSATLDVYTTLDELADKVPPGLHEMVVRAAVEPRVEDLDL
jgi:EXLDI family protein